MSTAKRTVPACVSAGAAVWGKDAVSGGQSDCASSVLFTYLTGYRVWARFCLLGVWSW